VPPPLGDRRESTADPSSTGAVVSEAPAIDPGEIGPGPDGSTWVAVTGGVIPVDRLSTWATLPGCGAVVTFCGTVRDHSEDRPGVTALEYEVHPQEAGPRLAAVADAARSRWPMIGRVAMVHRHGLLVVGEVSVAVVVSTPHRAEGFEAASYCIDTLKRTVPVWKRETWAGGTDWGLCTHDLEDVEP
jgi:molybdopterin synthase catalytic subunit